MKCPESIEELQELEQALPLCRITLYNQAKARIEKGSAKSVSEAARQLAEEAGKKPESIRRMINMGQAELGIDSQLSEISGTSKYTPKTKPETRKGGKELNKSTSGAMNKTKPVEEKEVEMPAYSNAIHFAIIAISQLERIKKDDPKKNEALNRVTIWINNKLQE